jgi:hypothetical protein
MPPWIEEGDVVVLPGQFPGDSGAVDAAPDHSDAHGGIVSVFHLMQRWQNF